MKAEQKRILTWLKAHGVSRRFRRYVGGAWTHISRLAGRIESLIGHRIRFISALMMGVIAALILAQCPIVGNLLAGLGLGLAVLTGLVAELKAEITR
jgi:hypothetical protein